MKIGIYCFTNLINNKKYIGQSVNIENRKRTHLRMEERDDSTAFHKALKKYGVNNFSFWKIYWLKRF